MKRKKLNIPTIAICDTNTDPTQIDFPIPANDDASKSIQLLLNVVTNSIKEGLTERNASKEQEREKQVADAEKKADAEGKEIDPKAGEVTKKKKEVPVAVAKPTEDTSTK